MYDSHLINLHATGRPKFGGGNVVHRLGIWEKNSDVNETA